MAIRPTFHGRATLLWMVLGVLFRSNGNNLLNHCSLSENARQKQTKCVVEANIQVRRTLLNYCKST